MNTAAGFAIVGTQLSLAPILIKPKRGIGTFTAYVAIEETHHDELEITNHPVDQGAVISDHAYKRPAELVIRAGWSEKTQQDLKRLYQGLLKLQSDRILFDVFTGKREYTGMLMKSLSVTTDKDTEHVLMITATFVQVIIVSTRLVTVASSPSDQANPAATQPPADHGTRQLVPSTQYDDGH